MLENFINKHKNEVEPLINKASCFLVFPHQLHKEILEVANKKHTIVFIEDPLFFFDEHYKIKHHKLKLVLYRASMKTFEIKLKSDGYSTIYFEFQSFQKIDAVIKNLVLKGFSSAKLFEPTDFMLKKRLIKACSQNNLELTFIESPNFLTSQKNIENYSKDKTKFFHADFYKWQRKRLNILVDSKGNSEGFRWSFDKENRKKLPKAVVPPTIFIPESSKIVQDAIDWVNLNFKDHPGNTVIYTSNTINGINTKYSYFFYPVSHEDAEKWFENFIENRLVNFGIYEDAIHSEFQFLYHSLLSPLLNIGLLSPRKIIKRVLEKYYKGAIPIQSCEGFIRQVIGWREYIRMMYVLIGTKQRNSNFFKHKKRIPSSFYNGSTNILPLDNVIKKINCLGYAHHIERLMLLGNFMLLSEFDPNEVYQWFMEMFIDSYDWVMVPNIYGMSQFADGGLMMRKPYISSSNYICKMSNYKREGKWVKVWDNLYWNFVKKNKLKMF